MSEHVRPDAAASCGKLDPVQLDVKPAPANAPAKDRLMSKFNWGQGIAAIVSSWKVTAGFIVHGHDTSV